MSFDVLQIVRQEAGQPVTLTDVAAAKVRELLADHDGALCLGVTGGGCSGFKYNLTLDTPHSTDLTYEQDGIPIAIAADAVPYLSGSTLTYKDGLMESGFEFDNPNVDGGCGCGSSFRLKDSAGCGLSFPGESAL